MPSDNVISVRKIMNFLNARILEDQTLAELVVMGGIKRMSAC